VSADERAAEFALLRALGLSPRQLSWWLTIEHAALMAFGILAGTAIGLLLAPLVLPFAGFTTTGLPAVPEPVVVVPWIALAPLYLTSIALVLLVAVLVARRLPRTSLTDTLRGREGAA
jgi:ABC-type antimicrobial peptide transport system permease subunit